MKLTKLQIAMLAKADVRSLPGDGLRIKGSGPNQSAAGLEKLGLVRLALFTDGQKTRVHITKEGRALLRGRAKPIGSKNPLDGAVDPYVRGFHGQLAVKAHGLPTPIGVAAVEGILDAIETRARDAGLTGAAPPALRAVFGMLLAVGLPDKGATIELPSGPTVTIHKADAQAVGVKSLTALTRLEVARVAKLYEPGGAGATQLLCICPLGSPTHDPAGAKSRLFDDPDCPVHGIGAKR